MAKVVTFGEIMMRLQTPGYKRFIQAQSLEVEYGGGEANVAVSVANYGMDACFVTKLPANPIGDACLAQLRKMNVCTKHVARGGERLGIYFAEKGASQRASNVVYDRAHSSIATAVPEDFDWAEIFKGADWFHFTGITPAISDTSAENCLIACKKAKEMGVKVSCDLNFRKKLWTSEKAGKVMGELMRQIRISPAVKSVTRATRMFANSLLKDSDLKKLQLLSEKVFRLQLIIGRLFFMTAASFINQRNIQ